MMEEELKELWGQMGELLKEAYQLGWLKGMEDAKEIIND